jgi:hypothetical protein
MTPRQSTIRSGRSGDLLDGSVGVAAGGTLVANSPPLNRQDTTKAVLPLLERYQCALDTWHRAWRIALGSRIA